ncbi:MAG: hypothetical protein HQL86_07640 [Magnetococcales bacterium]|nr:hypothetical protein [Magnetococcales bacterium]
MPVMKRRKERLVVLAVLGFLAINYPLIALFSQERMVFGVPALWMYLFLFWLSFVVLIALIMRRQSGEKV